ncbi:hypothetical protein R5R35_010953 [Gryllus longicercus]|uniref:Peptide-N(4)-(N-acetyl-beta-glucosaminyl)asparagine amidase n=2 Tax=Gryllus longicercus TaxID=2509291 RepID=A0AAN9VK52_9ORTH
MMGFLDNLRKYSEAVLRYENAELQKKALSIIPVSELENAAVEKMRFLQKEVREKKMKDDELPEIKDLLLIELLTWFKNIFFTWVDSPACEYCNGRTKFSGSSRNIDTIPPVKVEVYKCEKCHKSTEFIRHEDPWILLETRKGRCGEWANCFTLLCRAMGWDARHVVDVTDHVWTEVFSVSQDRWLHCDPCENVCDRPLMYEEGWGKKLSYVIAYSYDDIQDVTWRYSRKHADVLSRRQECTEVQLLEKLVSIRQERQQYLSKARKQYTTRRLVKELVEFMTPQKPDDEIYEGRTSGSLAWRLSRGEAGERRPAGGYVWQPTPAEKQQKHLHIVYSCAQDIYIRPTAGGEVMQFWEQGVFEAESISRKEEKDWKKVYLARKEGSSKALLSWKIDCQMSGFVIDKVQVRCSATVFHTGKIRLQLCGNVCVPIPADHITFETMELSGSESIILTADLRGGEGSTAWQHTQLFRQPLDDQSDFPLSINVFLKELGR